MPRGYFVATQCGSFPTQLIRTHKEAVTKLKQGRRNHPKQFWEIFRVNYSRNIVTSIERRDSSGWQHVTVPCHFAQTLCSKVLITP